MSSGSPPTLWWLLILAASFVPDSMTSGYSVPCTRNLASASPPAASSNTRMNSSPMALRLSSGSVTPGQAFEEPVGGAHVDELDALVAAEGLDHLLALAQAHEAGVDEDAGELGADGLVHQRRRHRRVDAAREAADGPAVADLGPDGLDLRLDDRAHRPVRAESAGVVEEVLEHLLAVRGVDDLGVELHAEDAAVAVLEGGRRRVAGAGRDRGARRAARRWCRSGSSTRAGRLGWVAPKSRLSAVTSRSVRPYSPRPVRATSPPRSRASSWAP